MTCAESDCRNVATSRGLCDRHRDIHRRAGTLPPPKPGAIAKPRQPQPEPVACTCTTPAYETVLWGCAVQCGICYRPVLHPMDRRRFVQVADLPERTLP